MAPHTDYRTDTAPPYASPSATAGRGRPWTAAGAVCAVLALFVLPILVGPAGAVLGFVGHRKGDRYGLWVAAAAVVTTVLGMVIGAVVWNAVR